MVENFPNTSNISSHSLNVSYFLKSPVVASKNVGKPETKKKTLKVNESCRKKSHYSYRSNKTDT